MTLLDLVSGKGNARVVVGSRYWWYLEGSILDLSFFSSIQILQ